MFSHYGSLRHIACYLSHEEFAIDSEWLKIDTETEKSEAFDELHKWLKENYPDQGAYKNAADVISRCYEAYAQSAFEKGMKYGANLIMGLMQSPIVRE